jgi:beta-lactamase superfamily II metal-dependent hydrolase
LDENRSWLEPAALDPATGMAVLCFQSYVVKTPHHTILVDACIGNDKTFPHRPTWHRKSDGNWMQALKAAGVTVDDIDIVMCTHLHGDHGGWRTAAGSRPFPMPNTSSRKKNTNIGTAFIAKRHSTRCGTAFSR